MGTDIIHMLRQPQMGTKDCDCVSSQGLIEVNKVSGRLRFF